MDIDILIEEFKNEALSRLNSSYYYIQTLTGVIMLLLYSLGLGIPFVVSALLIEKLKSAFTFIKKNYKIINLVSGLLLVVLGILMMTGLLNKLLTVIA